MHSPRSVRSQMPDEEALSTYILLGTFHFLVIISSAKFSWPTVALHEFVKWTKVELAVR